MVCCNFLSISNVSRVIHGFYAGNCPLGSNLGFFHQRDPKKVLPARETRFFEPSLTFVRLFVHVVHEHKDVGKGTQKRCTLSYVWMCGSSPVQQIVMIFGTSRDLADVISHAEFCIDQFKGFGHRKGQSWASPIGNCNGPYHCVLHYCAHA